jgi:ribonuclease HII
MKPNRGSTCDTKFERDLLDQGYALIAGVDEVGRGALAGPVVAAAVILDLARIPAGIDDSKKVPAARRVELAEAIHRSAVAVSIAAVEAAEIDRINILRATKRAMRLAIDGLTPQPGFLLIDAVSLSELKIPQRAIIHGDALSLSIAAASIVAKVARDQTMKEYDQVYPGYGFARNVGYGTDEHRQALVRFGPSPIHRLTFHSVQPGLF